MEIKGKIIMVLPEQSGVSRSGNNWKKREYVLETGDTYPRKVCFNLFGERADQYPMSVGDDVTVSFDLESREYNGRWYTDIRAWKVERNTGATAAPAAGSTPFTNGGEAPFGQSSAGFMPGDQMGSQAPSSFSSDNPDNLPF